MCSYSLGVPNYRLTYPPKTHPSTSPYTNLASHFKQLVKDGQLHRFILKAILYSDIRSVNTAHVRLRRKQNSHMRRRRSGGSSSNMSHVESGTNEDGGTSDAISSAASSVEFQRYCRDRISYGLREASHDTDQDTFIDHGSNFEFDCTKDIFASIERAQKSNNDVTVDRDSDGSFIFMHNRKNSNKKCDMNHRDSLKYYSKPVRVVIERNATSKTDSIVHTSTAELVIGGSGGGASSGASVINNGAIVNCNKNPTGMLESLRPGRKVSDLSGLLKAEECSQMAGEDFENIDDSLQSPMGKRLPIADERHSMPTLFVGNRFNCSSLTEVYIPSYREKKEAHNIDKKLDEAKSEDFTVDNIALDDDEQLIQSRYSIKSDGTTHSSSIDIPAMVPAPNDMAAELLYNLDESIAGASTSSRIASGNVIKPPSMFENTSRISLNKELSPFGAHALNSDKKVMMRRKSGEEAPPKNKRCISYHYINMHGNESQPQQRPRSKLDLDDGDGKAHTKKCECCASSRCPSPRSSDSGMAGSCTISSPDAPIKLFDQDYGQFDSEFVDESVPKMHSLMHSQSSHNFGRFNDIAFRGDNNHDSGQYGHSSVAPDEACGDAIKESDINNMFELSMSRDTVKRQSRCQSAERTKDHHSFNTTNITSRLVFKTGLYAHWWKKEVLPGAVLRDIHNLVHPKAASSSSAATSRGTTKPQRIGWDISRLERPQPDGGVGRGGGGEGISRIGWGSGKTFLKRVLLSFSVFLSFSLF